MFLSSDMSLVTHALSLFLYCCLHDMCNIVDIILTPKVTIYAMCPQHIKTPLCTSNTHHVTSLENARWL